MITHKYLKEVLGYNEITGVFTWLVNRNSYRGKVKVGAVANNVSAHGYIRIGIDGTRYQAHRLAWFYVYGKWPRSQIDHINRDRLDNRISNLREASDAQNKQNLGLNSRNTSGVTGVTWDKQRQKWFAKINHNYKQIPLGRFDNIQDATNAYAEAKRRLHDFSPES